MKQTATVAEDEVNGEPVTPEEVAEYRRMKPVLLQIVKDWPTLRGANGCPAMRHILAPD